MFCVIATPLGFLAAEEREDHLVAVRFVETVSLQPPESPLLKRWSEQMRAYFSGELLSFSLPLLPAGTLFQQRSWQVLSGVAFAETISYQEQARRMGANHAHRAVALANAANPLLILLPCHRVCRKNGDLGGYDAGVSRKAWLLAHERRVRSQLQLPSVVFLQNSEETE